MDIFLTLFVHTSTGAERNTMTNYHTHTELCHHADGMPADYLKYSMQDGCTELGFSDHCPYPYDDRDTWPNVRMQPEQAPGYIAAIHKAAQDVSFPVYTGFECEYAPCYETWYRDMLLGEWKADYLVLGQHWLPEGKNMIYAPTLSSMADIRSYIKLTIQAMETGLFAFLAHPDILMADGRSWNIELEAMFSDLIDAAISCRMPLEINGYGLVKKAVGRSINKRQPYPVDPFWELAAKKHATVICNSDAHQSKDVIVNAQKAREYAKRFGIIPLESLQLTK